MSRYQYEISFARYGGFYYNYIVWDRILQFLGVGKYYATDWIVGRIYVPSDMKLEPSTRWWVPPQTPGQPYTGMCKPNFTFNIFWCLKKKTEKMLTFQPLLCVHDDDVEIGEKMLRVHHNHRFADKNHIRNPIGEKLNINPQIPEGFGLYEVRNYYYKRRDGETDRRFKSRTKNNFFRKKKKASLKFRGGGKMRLNMNALLKLK